MCEDSAAEAHRWLKKPENPQIQVERVGNKVLSIPDKLLAGRAEQWKKLWVQGSNKIGEMKSALRRIRQIAIKSECSLSLRMSERRANGWAMPEVWALIVGRRKSSGGHPASRRRKRQAMIGVLL